MIEFLFAIAPTIVGGVLLAIVTGLLRKIVKMLADFRKEHEELLKLKEEFETFKKEHEALLESQRNQLKGEVVHIYETAKARIAANESEPFITHMELDVLNRQADSYFALGGNHYIHSVVKKANEMPVGGEEIPV